ncbi:fibulin-1 isoform X1 [Drosophila bipectinata]|uniref:fibulin-1 isoform X1 n=1 Tax=Drosophila bipectinata TaxID=42026 RepID=UPI001C89A566|nr:fibulin-1 isoform X1 [Drosophila bipectinata]
MLLKIYAIFYTILIGQCALEPFKNEQISEYIRKCCINGLRQARLTASCSDHDISPFITPQLWLGLCHSTFEVCCSLALDHQNCDLGRLAALEGTRCDVGENITSKAFTICCRSCQIGLAVKASKVNCKDPLFSFLSSMDAYKACCYEDDLNIQAETEKNFLYTHDNIGASEKKINSADHVDGTIILSDDDDICGKIPNLCAQICENTFDAYKCKCHLGYKLDSNNVTCSPDTNQTCPSGFNFDELREKCIDIDECREQIHECGTSQYCYNTIGSYHCLNVKNADCHNSDLNNCEEKEICNECNNNKQSNRIKKKCEDGYVFQNGSCTDIDECSKNTTYSCSGMHQECVNSLGNYSCQCLSGFKLDSTLNECIDINECSINNHNCLPTQRCDNTIGSYICTRLQSCGTGYTLNAETMNCDDDDECTLNTHNCPSKYDCYNTKGSFRCYRKTSTSTTTTTRPRISNLIPSSNYSKYPDQNTENTDLKISCSSGFHRNDFGACVDTDECQTNNPCRSHERCINTNGNYRCEILLKCRGGYKSTSDGKSCIDIDECETGEHNCGEGQICRNRNGGYVCECPLGHELKTLSNGSKSCLDINECSLDHRLCPSNAYCFNTIGSYYCECKPGFEKKMSNKNNFNTVCFDIDECKVIPGLCQQKCVNFWGGYRCTCNSGYQIGLDNRTCVDINECEAHKDYKLCMGSCMNTPGSFQCSCPRGYTLSTDFSTCRDIDECASDHVCTGRNDICTNTRGSYKCTTVNCPNGYSIDSEQKNRCRQSSITCEEEDCYSKPSAYTYNFITFVSKLIIAPEGRVIFTLRGPLWYDNIDFDLKIVRVQAPAIIERANERNFEIIKNNNQANLMLKKSLEGPQDIEIELCMTVFTNGMPRGKSIAKLFLFVSQHQF